MPIWLEVGLALLAAFLITLLWGYLREQTGSDRYDRHVANKKKGIDSIGVAITCMCHDGAGNYLVAKRSLNARDEQGTWHPLGGSVEFGELVEDTVRREVMEEFSTQVTDIEFLGFRDVHRTLDGRKTHWVVFDYKGMVDRASVKIGEPDMTDEIRWVTIDSIPAPLHSQFPIYLEKYKERL